MKHGRALVIFRVVHGLRCLVVAVVLASAPAAAVEPCAPWQGIPGCLHDFLDLEKLEGTVLLIVSAAEAEARVEYRLSQFVRVSMPHEYTFVPEKVRVRVSFYGTRRPGASVCKAHAGGTRTFEVSVEDVVKAAPRKETEDGVSQWNFMGTLLSRLPILIRLHRRDEYFKDEADAFRLRESEEMVAHFGPTRTPDDTVDNARVRAWSYERDKRSTGLAYIGTTDGSLLNTLAKGHRHQVWTGADEPRLFPGTETCWDSRGSTTRDVNFGFSIRLGGYDKRAHVRNKRKSSNVVSLNSHRVNFLYHFPPVETGKTLNLGMHPFSGRVDITSGTDARPYGQVKGTVYYAVGEALPFEATLEPVDPNERAWLPNTIDEKREFKLTLSEKTQESVAAVRFRLSDVSQHPGIAINAGAYKTELVEASGQGSGLLPLICPDSAKPVPARPWNTRGKFGEANYVRHYTGYGECSLDVLPDVFFRDVDNPQFDDMGPDAISDEYGLPYMLTHEITMNDVEAGEVVATLVIKDHAASARLTAEYMLGGIWLPAVPIGDTADGDYLMIPRDLDDDDVADAWEEQGEDYAVEDPSEDLDTHDSSEFLGDGLTAFEEYRGAYVEGTHTRLHPRRKNSFVHDYFHPTFAWALRYAKEWYAASGLDLVTISEDEFQGEVVNSYGSDHHQTAQYAIVLMDLVQARNDYQYQFPETEDPNNWDGIGGGAYRSPPRQGYNTAFINTGHFPVSYGASLDDTRALFTTRARTLARTVGHEIGHQMAIAHPGDHDFECDGKNGPHKVAVTGGEHSGNTASFMRYRVADKLLVREGCAAIGVVQRTYYQTSKSACDRLLPYVGGAEYRVTDLFADGPIAEEQFQFVPGPGGTGVNAGGRGAGSACRDGDLPQLNVRSPS